jgi:hypothetical protein
MKPRLPRKYKKRVNKIVYKRRMINACEAAVVVFESMARAAHIQSSIGYSPPQKAAELAAVVVDSALSVRKIYSEGPNSWRDFLKTKA